MTNKEYGVLCDIKRHIKYFDSISLEHNGDKYICKLKRESMHFDGYTQLIFISDNNQLFIWKPNLTEFIKRDGNKYTLEELGISCPCELLSLGELHLGIYHIVCSLLNRLLDVGYYLEQNPNEIINNDTEIKLR